MNSPMIATIRKLPTPGECHRSQQRNPYNADLHFLELWQGTSVRYALIDTGASINVIGYKASTKIKRRWLSKHPEPINGIGGTEFALGIIITSFNLASGDTVTIEFTVIKELQAGIILGLPFLKFIHGIIDICNHRLSTCFGDLPLETPCSIIGPEAWVETLETMDPEVKVRAADYVNNLVQATDNLRLQAEAKLKNTALEGHQRHRVIDLLLQFRDLWEGDRRGATPTTTHTITLTTTRPLATRPRRFTPEQQRAIETEVQAMEAADVIEDSESPYASDVVLVRKPTGAWRFCIDF